MRDKTGGGQGLSNFGDEGRLVRHAWGLLGEPRENARASGATPEIRRGEEDVGQSPPTSVVPVSDLVPRVGPLAPSLAGC